MICKEMVWNFFQNLFFDAVDFAVLKSPRLNYGAVCYRLGVCRAVIGSLVRIGGVASGWIGRIAWWKGRQFGG